MENIKHYDEEIKDNTKIENISFNKQIVKEIKNTVDSIDKTLSSIFNSIDILQVNEKMFDVVQRTHVLSKDIKEIKELCEGSEENCKKEDFIQRVESDFKDAKDRGFNRIVIVIDTDSENTYYINDTEKGFQCDLFDYVFDDLSIISDRVYDKIQGNIVDVRIDKA